MGSTTATARPITLAQQPVRGSHSLADDSLIYPIDTDALLARCMGNLAFAQSLLTELESTGTDRVEEIRRFAATGDCNSAAEAAHSLKGAAAIMGAEPIRNLAAEIEALGRAGVKTQLTELADQLGKEMKICLDFIPKFNAKPTGR